MRLVCPNCGAQYEVDDAVIPDGGRDVQCSNCGHGWFQPSKDMLSAEPDTTTAAPPPEGWDLDTETEAEAEAASEETEAEVTAETPIESEALSEPEQVSEPEPLPEPEQQPEPEAATPLPEPEPVVTTQSTDDTDAAIAAMVSTPEPEDQDDDEEDEPGLGPAPRVGATPRKPLDDGLLSILREEAEREAAQRRAEGSSELETQDELNLEERETSEDAERAAEAAAADLARRRKSAQDFSDLNESEEDRVADLLGEDDEDMRAIRGRERLPDIDEINSTLTATSDREGDSVAEFSPEMARRRRSGFSRGFIFVMAITAILALLYAFAPDIAAKVPALKSPLTQYVVAVDEGRIWLDDQLQILTHRLSPEATSDGFTE
ncbi:zinc-ribbon domain-containing protein [Thioclava sp.]|uniref:zinc-ribbon domain-containing protein n=1 Tax=Thioclava sp. TaxID=1933450 RepID=UPI0032426DA6